MKKLSKTQQTILDKMERGKWYCAFTLSCSIATLEAMCHKDYLVKKSGVGSFFCPRTAVEFRRV